MSSHLSLVNKSLSTPESKPMDMSVKLKYPQLSFEKNYERLLTLHENTTSSGPLCCHLVVEKFNNETRVLNLRFNHSSTLSNAVKTLFRILPKSMSLPIWKKRSIYS